MPKRRHEPRRTCVACRQEASKDGLIRFVGRDGAVVIDPTGKAPGRGAYLHREAACVALARRRALLDRALKGRVPDEVWNQAGQLIDAKTPGVDSVIRHEDA